MLVEKNTTQSFLTNKTVGYCQLHQTACLPPLWNGLQSLRDSTWKPSLLNSFQIPLQKMRGRTSIVWRISRRKIAYFEENISRDVQRGRCKHAIWCEPSSQAISVKNLFSLGH